MSTTGNVLNDEQQAAFQKYIQGGGGYVGIHAATDTEYDWPWYNQLVGAYFKSHPKQQKAVINVVDATHISTQHLPAKWERFDEWYNFKSIQNGLHVLLTIDEKAIQAERTAMCTRWPGTTILMAAAPFILNWGIRMNLSWIRSTLNIF
jgi:type 1 glutamine amidotransferase